MKAHFVEATSIEVLGASKTEYLELFYFVDIVAWFGYNFYQFLLLLRLQPISSTATSAPFSRSLLHCCCHSHIHLQAWDYAGSLVLHLLPLLLLGFAGTIHFSSSLLCTDGPSAGSIISFLVNFWRLAPVQRCFSGNLLLFLGTDSFFKILDFCTLYSRLKTMRDVLHIIYYHAFSIFLLEHHFFTRNCRGNCSLSYRSNQLHQGPAKAKARQGRQWCARRTRSLLNAYLLLFWIQLFSRARLYSGHEPCSASRDLSPSGVILIFYIHWYSLAIIGSFFRWFGFHPPVAASSFHWVPCIRCWLAPYPEAQWLLFWI